MYIKAAKQLSKEYILAKGYNLDGTYSKRKTFNYTCIFVEKREYELVLAENNDDPKEDQLTAYIFDADSALLFTTNSSGTLLRKLNFSVAKTGIYYLVFEWGKQPTCGAAVLGFCRFFFKPNKHYEVEINIDYEDATEEQKVFVASTSFRNRLRMVFLYRDEEQKIRLKVKRRSNVGGRELIQLSLQEAFPELQFSVDQIRKVE